MILPLPQIQKSKQDITIWHKIFCWIPRIIEGNFVWLTAIERKGIWKEFHGYDFLMSGYVPIFWLCKQ